MAKVARVGKREELDFAEEARTRQDQGSKLPRKMKISSMFWRSQVLRWSRAFSWTTRKLPSARATSGTYLRRQGTSQSGRIIVAGEESQLRQFDRERRWGQEDGVWIYER